MQFVLYTRVSTEEQGHSRNGLEAQLSALQAFVVREGGTTLAHYEEVASGAASLDDRPMLRQAVAHARRSKALLLVSKLDRLSRSVELISRMMNETVRFATAEDGLDCDPFMLHIKAVFAERERRLISERTRAALQAKKARGEPLGHHTHKAPSSIVKAREAAGRALAEAADSHAARLAPVLYRLRGQGLTLAQTAAELNALGHPTAKGGLWHASTVCNILKRLDKRV